VQKSLQNFFLTFVAAGFAYLAAVLALMLSVEGGIFSPIVLPSDPSWIMTLRYSSFLNRQESQDRDILYYGIGKLIEHARDADIVILGHSMALFGFDWRMLDDFANSRGVRIVNLSSAGDVSGEFLLRVIEKFRIKPKIWIINADDYAGRAFFVPEIDEISEGEAGQVMRSGWLAARIRFAFKNLEWRLGALYGRFTAVLPEFLRAPASFANFRSDRNGAWLNDFWPHYQDSSNPIFVNDRGPECRENKRENSLADRYVRRLRAVAPDSSVILTLVPYAQGCNYTTNKIAETLGVPFIDIPPVGFTSYDGGGHLDGAGAHRFTAKFLNQLKTLEPFLHLMAGRPPGPN
jgi:hypothetical protein